MSIVLARTGWLAEVLARQLQGCSLADALDSAPCKYSAFLTIYRIYSGLDVSSNVNLLYADQFEACAVS